MSTEHWFDRFSTRLSRRQVVKGALFGTAALAVRMPGAPPARADAPSSQKCFKGCVWTAQQHYDSRRNACRQGDYGVPVYGDGGPIGRALAAARQKCFDDALLQYKADWYDCNQPSCGGFDPKQKGGPCDGCSNNCCTCQASDNGYICCVFTCDDPNHNCCPGG